MCIENFSVRRFSTTRPSYNLLLRTQGRSREEGCNLKKKQRVVISAAQFFSLSLSLARSLKNLPLTTYNTRE